ncbi:MAG TPA: DNA gyrase subunit A [Thermoanaerobaculia bacterium]|nr:DNA gyrase subunit A [Thermoanaerobaculia bacterium]
MTIDDPNIPVEQPILVDIEEEMKRSYLDYAMSVIIGRALPDVRDGLKPVHRRVLYGMWESGNTSNRAYKKSARIVGDVMGKYHPHGDAAIYDTVVRMAQDFSLRYPLVDGQGNFGSLDGDPPAAMRYTEVRLTKLAEEMIRDDIDKETVDWVDNYDGSEREPTVLPARVPNLLVNGSSGIAVGMATNIPPHSLKEVVDALEILIDRPDASLDEVMAVLPGPDFPTGGFIHGIDGIRSAYATGRGIVQMRARAEIETDERSDRQAIVITEIPYQLNKARLLERIAELVREKKVDGITDLRDESDRTGIRIVLDVRRGEVPEVLLNSLYKHTQMQSTFGIIMLAIVDNQPKVLDLRSMLRYFLDHRKTVVVRRTRYDLRKAEERAHVLEGILKALDHLDEVIATIRASRTPADARENLMTGFALSEVQAQAILDMRLQRLTGLERDKVVEEYRELMATIERLRAILGSDRLVLEEIRKELRALRETYGDARRTQILPHTADISIEDMIADEDMVITVTQTGYVKRSPLALYRAQHRGGKGRTGMLTREGDFVEHLYVASAHSYVLVFTASGRVYWVKVHAIPEAGPAARGKAIVNLLDLDKDEKLATTVAVREFSDDHYLVFATRAGRIKKTPLAAYSRPLARGIHAIGIVPGDELLNVRITDGTQDLLLATADGRAIRFAETEVRTMGRTAAGVRGMHLRKGDRVVAMEALAPDAGDVFTITERGYGKRTAVGDYPQKHRAGLGVINLRVSDKTGPVIAVRQVSGADELILISQEGKILRTPVDAFRVIGRSTQGVKIMDLGPEDRLVAAAKLVERDDEETAEGEAPVAELEEIVDQPTPMSDESGPGGATEIEEPEDLEPGDAEPEDGEPGGGGEPVS